MTLSPMDGCLRCPSCNLLPRVIFTNLELPIVLECEQHGHMASGRDLPQAVQHWNKYIQAMVTKFPQFLRKPSQSKQDKAISDAAFGIDPTEDK